VYEVVKTPPKSANPRPRHDWRAIAKAARKSKGEWVVIHDLNGGVADHIRKATYAAFAPAGAFEVESRLEPLALLADQTRAKAQRRVTLYVRYVL